MLDFGTPWRPAGSQNGAQNRPSGAKSLKKKLPGGVFGADLFSESVLERSWAPFRSIWDGFWMNFDEF